ncbi:MAG: type 1 glutamine amidotransferase [Bacillota bacterium]
MLIQNEAEVPAGRVLEVLEHLKWEAEVVRMDNGDLLPPSFDGFDCLVILGGTMNVDDTQGYPYLESLRHLAASALNAGFPVMGLCLGAQVMARAAGAEVHKSRCGEIGWCNIGFTGEGLRDPVLEGLPSLFEVFHWHDDMFEIPESGALLAKSGQCPHQIIRIGRHSYGFQCHPEVTIGTVNDWLERYHQEVEEKLGPGGADRLAKLTAQKMPLYDHNCRRIFVNFFNIVKNRPGVY